MIGIDTNVVVRYIMQDDPRQSAQATRFMESLTSAAPGFLSHVVLVELVWVLSSAYDLSRDEVTQVLEQVLQTKEVIVERAPAMLGTSRGDIALPPGAFFQAVGAAEQAVVANVLEGVLKLVEAGGLGARFELGLSEYRRGEMDEAFRLLAPFSTQSVDGEEATELHAVLAEACAGSVR